MSPEQASATIFVDATPHLATRSASRRNRNCSNAAWIRAKAAISCAMIRARGIEHRRPRETLAAIEQVPALVTEPVTGWAIVPVTAQVVAPVTAPVTAPERETAAGRADAVAPTKGRRGCSTAAATTHCEARAIPVGRHASRRVAGMRAASPCRRAAAPAVAVRAREAADRT